MGPGVLWVVLWVVRRFFCRRGSRASRRGGRVCVLGVLRSMRRIRDFWGWVG